MDVIRSFWLAASPVGLAASRVRRPPQAGGAMETVAKVPLEASKHAHKWHGEGVEFGFCAFLQQSPEQPDPTRGHAQKCPPKKLLSSEGYPDFPYLQPIFESQRI